MTAKTQGRPNFFIVGAPKCGTTALNRYLRQHPQIFMPERKDITYFGTDLNFRQPRISREEYLALFQQAKDAARVGEASVWYLYSAKAAQEIQSFSPSAKIIVMFRNPVDMLYAQHSHFLYNLDEDIASFEAALEAEAQRKQGLCIPPRSHFVQGLFYRDTIKYAEQVQRYFDVFGRNNVHVILFDDLKQAAAKVYRETLRFLRVEASFEPKFPIVNSNKRFRSKHLQQLLSSPSPLLAGFLSRITPAPFRGRLWMRFKKLNTRYLDRPALDPALRRRLQAEFQPEVRALADLLEADLSNWSNS